MASRITRRQRPKLHNYRRRRKALPSVETKVVDRVLQYWPEYKDFLLGPLDFDRDEDAWEPAQMLGAGSFGQVGLWVKRRTTDGTVVDEFAVKDAQRAIRDEPDPVNHEGLTEEVVLHTQINQSNCKNLAHLRRYKYYPGPDRSTGAYRMFLLYCTHGTLGSLARRYRAFDQYLPEVFLWHVFHSLARALVVFEQGTQYNWWTGDSWPPESHFVHMDLKPANILLGEVELPTSGRFSCASHYPSIQISDFGLSTVTGTWDRFCNPSSLWGTGTPINYPLEQKPFRNPSFLAEDKTASLPSRIYGATFNKPPNGRTLPWEISYAESKAYTQDPGFTFGTPHNVGAVGKIMFDLLKLALPDDFYYEAAANDVESIYNDLGRHAIFEIEVQLDGLQVYTRELRDLVRECCRPAMALRPTPADLKAATATGLTIAQDVAAADPNQDRHRLFFVKNEINHMPRGRAAFPADKREWKRMMRNDWLAPEWGALVPPIEKWAGMMKRYRLTAYGVYRNVEGEEVDFDDCGKMFFLRFYGDRPQRA